MKKLFALMLVAVLTATMLVGCCLSHDWAEATCEAPMTCTKCGETEGEALGHNFVGGTCAEPSICEKCGSEGEFAEHVWLDATRTAPQTCEVCGQTQGEPLTALEAFPIGSPRHDGKAFIITAQDFLELYQALVEDDGFVVGSYPMGDHGATAGVNNESVPGGNVTMMIGGNDETGMLESIIITIKITDPNAIETYAAAATAAAQVLTGLDDEAYRAASDAGMENAKGNETTILYEVEGVACMVKNIMGSTMMYLTLADA